MATTPTREIRPQTAQERVLSCDSDIAIMGGAAGGGKTFSLLMEPLYHIHVKEFSAVIFRRIHPMIVAEGGIWDDSLTLYPHAPLSGEPKVGDLSWEFPSGATIRFSHLQYEQDVLTWYSSQIPLLMFDQLEQFTRKQFFEMLTRNRSTCGVRPYVRASCNPDPDSFLADFLSWWIGDDGYAIPKRAGQTRWFVRLPSDELAWDDSAEALKAIYGEECTPLSVTFFPMLLDDNPALTSKDPGYRSRLLAQPRYLRERLLGGNWKSRPTAGQFFQRHWFRVVEAAPAECTWVRCWDRAATEPSPQNPDPDWTAGVKIGRDARGFFYVGDVRRARVTPKGVEDMIVATASQDGHDCVVALLKDPGQAGKMESEYLTRQLAGYRVALVPQTKNKETVARPFASQAEAGNVLLVRGPWTDAYLQELENFPGRHDDQVDGSSNGFNLLAGTGPAEGLTPAEIERIQREARFASARAAVHASYTEARVAWDEHDG